MSYLILPSRRTRQPSGPVRIAWNEPLAAGITLAWHAAALNFNAATERTATVKGQTVSATGVGLVASSNSAANDGIDFGQIQPAYNNAAFSIAVFSAPVNSASAKIAFSQRQTANNANQIDLMFARNRAFSTDGRYVSFYLRDTGGNVTGADNESTVSTSAPNGQMHLWGGTVSGSTSKLWRDGIDITGGGGTASGTLVHSGQYTRINNFADYSADGLYASPTPTSQVIVWGGRTLSALEWGELYKYPWHLYTQAPRRIYFDAGAGGGAVTLSPTEGHLLAVGYSPGISQERTLAPSTGALHLVGYQPGIVQSAGQTLFPSTGHEVLQGYAPGLSQARTLAPATGTELLQGYVPGVFQSVITTLAPSTGHLVLTGSAPGITQARTLTPSTGHVYLAGYAPVVEQVAGAQTIAPLSGSILLSGYAPAVSNAPLQPPSSSFSFGGGGGGGNRAWKEAGFDEKLDKIVEEWQEQHSPKPASKPAQDPAKPETAPVPAKEAREDEREELDQSALADLIADRVVAKLTPLLASNKQLAEEAFIFRLIQAGKL